MESSGPYLGTASAIAPGIVFDEFFDHSGSPNETVRVCLVSRIKHHLTAGQDGLCFAKMNYGRG